MKYCVNCGRQLNDDNNFCPDCGYKNAGKIQYAEAKKEPQGDYNERYSKEKDKKSKENNKKRPGCLVAILIAVLVLAVIIAVSVITAENQKDSGDHKNSEATSIEQDSEMTVDTEINVEVSVGKQTPGIIVDVNEYEHLSSEELIEKLGTPDSIEEGPYSGELGLNCTWYCYGNDAVLGDVQFELIDDKVERFAAYNDWKYPGKDNLLASFGIQSEDSCYIEADTGVTVRYLFPSSNIGEFSAELIEGDELGFIRVTYDIGLYRTDYAIHISSEDENDRDELSQFKKHYDKVDGCTVYMARTTPTSLDVRSFVLPYIATTGEDTSLCLTINYSNGENILGWTEVIFAIDGERYSFELDYWDVLRDWGKEGNWYEEAENASINDSDRKMLRKISESKETIVRFVGDTDIYDYVIPSSDKEAIAEMLDAYELVK